MGLIDFTSIAGSALSSIDSLLNSWLPGGRREGHEYKALNPKRSDNKLGSFSINLRTGYWADFADSDSSAKGGDLISLFGYLHNLAPLEAAKEVAQQLGIEIADRSQKPARAQAVTGGKAPASKPQKEAEKVPNWVPIVPVPENAPPVPVAHIKRGKPDRVWIYRDAAGLVLGYIWRFTTSDGGKEIVPFTYCRHSTTGAQEWRNIQFADPRPLYVPWLDFREGVTKLIVEGEKCADAAHLLLNDRFDVATWPGGGKALQKADWSRFVEGDKVLIWPDCDAQREKLSKDEKDAGFEPEQKPFLPEEKQPGIAAAEKIAQLLMARGCIVRIVKIPAPGDKPPGWDIADAIEEGWTAEQLKTFVLDNLRAPAEQTSDVREADILPFERQPATGAGAGDADWKELTFWKDGRLRECRENVFLILKHLPAWKGCLALDEFSNAIRVRRDTSIDLQAGALWDEDQDFKLGLWCANALRLFIKAEGMLSAGVRAVAVDNKYHPVRDYLDGLPWDGVDRLEDWLTDYAGVPKTEYSSLIGRLFLIGMVARIYQPGCKMDTALILEGLQGEGKSSIAKALAGEWFSDTTFVMGDKDSFLALRGKWVYELAELDSFNRSESTRAKAFISSPTDSYRAPYERVTKDWPRQCVFIGTTNQYEYFKDSSGNRRYLPVLCSERINPQTLHEMRDQLFAEAVHRYRAGEHWWPTREQQDRLITPEQEARELQDAWELAIYEWLTVAHLANEVTALEILCGALKMEVSKIDGARQSMMRIGVCMRKLHWTKKRRSTGAREWVYVRPQPIKQENQGDENGIPF